MTQYTKRMDKNGNAVVRIDSTRPGRSFSIQTNGNLPETHRLGVGSWTVEEVAGYVEKYGTERQREKVR